MEIVLKIKLIPKSSKRGIIADEEGVLRVKVNSPPVDGKANAECIKLLAREFKIAKSKIEITSGKKNREKLFRIYDIEKKDIEFIKGFFKKQENQQ